MDAVQKADSGHPGTPMALAPLAYVLWTKHLRYNPADPGWLNRDRFVLSAGHASMLLYSVLYLTGYELTLDDIKQFRQWESKTPGHPELGYTPGVETTTGPLGQGIGNAVGMAVGEAHLGAVFNRDQKIIDHNVYFIASDGDMMEGVSHEAASARVELLAAEEQLVATGMMGFLQIARLRRGRIEGGAVGTARAEAARDFLKDLGAIDPERAAWHLLPWPS